MRKTQSDNKDSDSECYNKSDGKQLHIIVDKEMKLKNSCHNTTTNLIQEKKNH